MAAQQAAQIVSDVHQLVFVGLLDHGLDVGLTRERVGVGQIETASPSDAKVPGYFSLEDSISGLLDYISGFL